MVPVLAISGKRFFGKDTFAAMLVKHARVLGYALPTYAFADESKRMFAALEEARGEDINLERLLHERDYKERVRPALTRFTVEALSRDPLVFCRAVAQRIETEGRPAVITDLRLRVEHAHLASRFALRVVRLARSDGARRSSGWEWKDGVDDHHTECELDDPSLWHEVVDNSGTLEELSEKAEATIATFLRGSGALHSGR